MIRTRGVIRAMMVAVYAAGLLTRSAATLPAQQADSRTTSAAEHRLLERYEGHLTPADGGFSVTLYHDGTASAEWTRQSGAAVHYSGAYSGADGNYRIKLTPAAGQTGAKETLSITSQSTGGMVKADYAEGAAVHRDANSLRLMEVDSGDVKLKSTKAGSGRSAAGRSANRRSRGASSRAAAARARRAMNRAARTSRHRINP